MLMAGTKMSLRLADGSQQRLRSYLMMDQRYKLSVSTGAKAPIFVRLWTARLTANSKLPF